MFIASEEGIFFSDALRLGAVHAGDNSLDAFRQGGFQQQGKLEVEHYAAGTGAITSSRRMQTNPSLNPHWHGKNLDDLLHEDEGCLFSDKSSGFIALCEQPVYACL